MELPVLLTFTGKATLMHQEAFSSPMSPHYMERDASPLRCGTFLSDKSFSWFEDVPY